MHEATNERNETTKIHEIDLHVGHGAAHRTRHPIATRKLIPRTRTGRVEHMPATETHPFSVTLETNRAVHVFWNGYVHHFFFIRRLNSQSLHPNSYKVKKKTQFSRKEECDHRQTSYPLLHAKIKLRVFHAFNSMLYILSVP